MEASEIVLGLYFEIGARDNNNTMTKKDYELIAGTILDWQKYGTVQEPGVKIATLVPTAHAVNLVDMLMQQMHARDSKFSDAKFAAACGFTEHFLA